MAWRIRPTGRSSCPIRCRARPSMRTPCRAIPTAGICCGLSMPSPDRITPFCPHFGVCGGCAIQHWAEPHYRAWKRNLVVGCAPSRADRCAGRRPDRCAWRGPPPRGTACAAGHERDRRGRLLGFARAYAGADRSLSGAGAVDGRRDRQGLGHRRGAGSAEEAARHSRDRNAERTRYRRARLRRRWTRRARPRSRAWPHRGGSRGSPGTARWWR